MNKINYFSILAYTALYVVTVFATAFLGYLDVPGNDMEGCIHTLKNGYLKASAREFIHLLGQSTAILKNLTLKGM